MLAAVRRSAVCVATGLTVGVLVDRPRCDSQQAGGVSTARRLDALARRVAALEASAASGVTTTVIIIGGGIMGSATAWKLSLDPRQRVVLLDENHAVRGSWGQTRASHCSMEDDVLLRMVNGTSYML
jgi:hypothetical protein